MYLEKLTLCNYRNFENIAVGFSPQVNLFFGHNAQGKTNLLEAIYYLSLGKTYRVAQDEQLIKWNSAGFGIKGEIRNRQGSCKIEIALSQAPDSRKVKEIKINGLKIRKMSELLGNLTAVHFAPEDLNVVKGTPAERRRFLDSDMSQASPAYYTLLQRYNRVLTQRNHLLKELSEGKRKKSDLEIWDAQFVELSAEITGKRMQFLRRLSPLTAEMQSKLTDGQEHLEIKYLINKNHELGPEEDEDIKQILLREAEKRKTEEQRRGQTLWGPHRDDLLLLLNGNDLKAFGSQGQHRTAVLAIKLAEMEFFKFETGEYPVLLLDDVLSELDVKRRELLLQAIGDQAVQCFITTTEDEPDLWTEKKEGKRYNIWQGTIR